MSVVLVAAGALYARSTLGGSVDSMATGVRIPGTDLVIGAGSTPTNGKSRDIRGLWPPVPSDAGEHPLATPPAKASSSREFTFARTVDDRNGSRPVAWDPCRPIHLVVNGAQAPTGSERLLREAVAEISSATGLRFVFDGSSDEAPSADRKPQDEDRYGNRWSPVLVAWTDPGTVPELKGAVAGLAGPEGAPYYVAAQEHWVSGLVNLDGPQLSAVLRRPGGWDITRAIIMHELGHLVGLKHVRQSTELMYAESTNRTTFGPGDREGLRRLGLGPCFTA